MIHAITSPQIAAMMLSVLELQKLNFDLEQGIDQHFSKLALADGKKIVRWRPGISRLAFDGRAQGRR
jgi:hypothetical protein